VPNWYGRGERGGAPRPGPQRPRRPPAPHPSSGEAPDLPARRDGVGTRCRVVLDRLRRRATQQCKATERCQAAQQCKATEHCQAAQHCEAASSRIGQPRLCSAHLAPARPRPARRPYQRASGSPPRAPSPPIRGGWHLGVDDVGKLLGLVQPEAQLPVRYIHLQAPVQDTAAGAVWGAAVAGEAGKVGTPWGRGCGFVTGPDRVCPSFLVIGEQKRLRPAPAPRSREHRSPRARHAPLSLRSRAPRARRRAPARGTRPHRV